MMHMLRNIFYWLTPYVNVEEWRVATMFARFREGDSRQVVAEILQRAIQHNVAMLSLWAEYRYKGYDYLTKATRRKLYVNLQKIRRDFDVYREQHTVTEKELDAQLAGLRTNSVVARSHPEKLLFLAQIMSYLHPSAGRYRYRPSSSFGRLLQDPQWQVLEGDCNQIVTLYIYLYATAYEVSDLRLVIFPNHIALRFQGVDIEPTTGTWARYDDSTVRVSEVQEIVSVNLLDTRDAHLQTHHVSAEVFLEAAKLAYLVSSEREVVRMNLKASYHNAVKELLEKKHFQEAMRYADQSGERELVDMVGHGGTLHYMQRHDYARAKRFAARTNNAATLLKTVTYNQGVHYYKAKKYHEAIAAFRQANDPDMVKRCYEALFLKEQEKLRQVRTTEDLKAHSRTLARMKDYAVKSGNARLIELANKLKAQ